MAGVASVTARNGAIVIWLDEGRRGLRWHKGKVLSCDRCDAKKFIPDADALRAFIDEHDKERCP